MLNAANTQVWAILAKADGVAPFAVGDPPTKVSLPEVAVWFPTSEIMVLSQQALQVGTRVSPKWGSYRGESNSI